MTIGVLQLDFLVPGSRSLKDKRRVIKSLRERMRGRFNCAVAETEFQDVWNRARLTVCVVSTESQHANTQLNEIARFASQSRDAEMIDYQIQML
jgi:uncharacterized protein YlxP (DUF503 family)